MQANTPFECKTYHTSAHELLIAAFNYSCDSRYDGQKKRNKSKVHLLGAFGEEREAYSHCSVCTWISVFHSWSGMPKNLFSFSIEKPVAVS
jgi:hypothetical protein